MEKLEVRERFGWLVAGINLILIAFEDDDDFSACDDSH
jgi:hypothetical protein